MTAVPPAGMTEVDRSVDHFDAPRRICHPWASSYIECMDRPQSTTAPEAQQRTFVAAVWLVLAAIFAHALLPVGTPMARQSGSAFSAATVDVSLQPVRSSTLSHFALQDEDSRTGANGADWLVGADDASVAPAGARFRLDPGPSESPAMAWLPISHRAASWPQAARAPPIP